MRSRSSARSTRQEAERGVPIESLILPAVAAIGCLGAIGLVPVGIWLVPALAATAFLVDRTLRLEERIVASDRALTADDRSEVLVATLLVGFVAFAGAGTLVPGGLAGGVRRVGPAAEPAATWPCSRPPTR